VVAASWEERRLCDDGACTGLIGNDGLCRVCGRASNFWGDERRRGMQDDDEDAGDEGAPSAGESAGGADEDERALCPDGSCTGLLDIDGRCKVCGKVDESQAGRARSRVAGGADAATAATAPASRDDVDRDEGDDDDERQLCPDGACTGLIGSDGACKVCGRRAEA
jgi:hypothetical protein